MLLSCYIWVRIANDYEIELFLQFTFTVILFKSHLGTCRCLTIDQQDDKGKNMDCRVHKDQIKYQFEAY